MRLVKIWRNQSSPLARNIWSDRSRAGQLCSAKRFEAEKFRPNCRNCAVDRSRTARPMYMFAMSRGGRRDDTPHADQTRSFQKNGPSAALSQRYLSTIWRTRVTRAPIAPITCTTIVSTVIVERQERAAEQREVDEAHRETENQQVGEEMRGGAPGRGHGAPPSSRQPTRRARR